MTSLAIGELVCLTSGVSYICHWFNVPPLVKVIWRRGHGLESHPTDRRSRGSTLGIPGYKVHGLFTTPWRLMASVHGVLFLIDRELS